MAIAEGRTIPFVGPEAVDVAVLETFEYAGPDQEIVTETREFSPVCPYSGLPDFATLRITYVPSDRCIELKSLKYYVTSYRNVGIFQEHATAKIAVGNDAGRLSGDQNRADVRALHLASGFGNGYIRCNEHGRDFNQVLNRLDQTIIRLCSGVIGHKRGCKSIYRRQPMGVCALFAIREFPSRSLARENGDSADKDECEPEESVKEQRP